jgi:hypothetical protein
MPLPRRLARPGLLLLVAATLLAGCAAADKSFHLMVMLNDSRTSAGGR